MEIISRNTNTLAPSVYAKLNGRGETFTSRNGPVIRIMEPFTVCLLRPWERVNFSAIRDCNPFFHLMEAMAMLAPVNNVGLMAHFAKSMSAFSDNGVTFNAFYGTRARDHFRYPTQEGLTSEEMASLDQLDLVIKELIEKPDSRQCVVQLWDPVDLVTVTKDKACNLCMLFDIVPGEPEHGDGTMYPTKVVRMTTFNRSNDAVLGGITGANVVHFSFFHEYVARGIGVAQGSWWHVSNNLHAYVGQAQWQRVSTTDDNRDEYHPPASEPTERVTSRLQRGSSTTGIVSRWEHTPLFTDRATFDRELRNLMERMAGNYATLKPFEPDFKEAFLSGTIVPAFNAWQAYKREERELALELCGHIEAPDWQLACTQWMERRQPKPAAPDVVAENPQP